MWFTKWLMQYICWKYGLHSESDTFDMFHNEMISEKFHKEKVTLAGKRSFV